MSIDRQPHDRPAPRAIPRFAFVLSLLASHWLTLAAIIATGAGVVVSDTADLPYTWSLALPLFLFAVNLIAAMVVHPRFRRQTPLLIFHLALLAVIVLAAASRMTYLQGWAEVATGQAFDGHVLRVEKGPWHPETIDRVRFVNEGFSIDYAPGLRRRNTFNKVSWIDERGAARQAVIGDDNPLVIGGYRFYTSANKGFTAVFEWEPDVAGAPYLAVVNLPSYPYHALNQASEVQLPGIDGEVWAQLQLSDDHIPKDAHGQFRLPDQHSFVIRHGNDRWQISKGEWATLRAGRLRYVELTSWMGYRVYYDWTRPWLVAALVTACMALGWYVWPRITARDWQRDSTPPSPRDISKGNQS